MTGPDHVVDPDLAARMKESLAAVTAPAADPVIAGARSVAATLRSLIDILTGTTAPPEVLADAEGRLAQIRDALASYDAVRRYEGASEASGLAQGRAHFDWSPLLGLASPLAPPIRVAVEGRQVVSQVNFGLAYEGPPGCVHGGFIAAAFDEVLGLTQSLSGRVGMTGTLTVRYRRPTPLRRDLTIISQVESVEGRKVLVSGRMLDGEELTAEATGLFVSVSPDRFQSMEANRETRPGG